MSEQAEMLIQQFCTLMRQALTLSREGHLEEANKVWRGGIVQTFAELWRLTQEPLLQDFPYCGGKHTAGTVETCPLNPNKKQEEETHP